MKIILNPMFEQASGQLGDLVFREVRGKTVASRKATVTGEPTVEQVAHRERFKQAAAYGKSALADATVRALYEAAAKEKDMPVFALTIADFFNAPTIDNVDVLAYNGQVGDLIRIMARDDFGVVSVHVTITTDQGVAIESGNAVESSAGSGQWVYTATTAVTSGTDVIINAVATDRPGGTAVLGKPRSI